MNLICGNIWPKVAIICDICGKKIGFLIFSVFCSREFYGLLESKSLKNKL
jgi:hypothetical protein